MARRSRVLLSLLAAAVLVATWGAAAFVQGAEARIARLPSQVRAELVTRGGPYVALTSVSPAVIESVVATEDVSFWTNPGISLEGTLRALFVDIETKSYAEGGSTITQQLARDQYLGDQKTLRRKLAELAYALLIARRYPKPVVLELFLNQAYFGHGAWGIAAAAQTYFGVPARDLTLAQSALVVGLLQAPSALDPLLHPGAARQRQGQVLQELVSGRYISAAVAAAAAKAPLGLLPAGA